MRFKRLYFIAVLFGSINLFAQEGKITITKDARIDELISLKTTLQKADLGFQIQIFNGDRANAMVNYTEAKAVFTDQEVTLQYQTPNYKVWIGKFNRQLEADKYLIEVKKIYPNAFVLKPASRN
jgi:hypothetical protein